MATSAQRSRRQLLDELLSARRSPLCGEESDTRARKAVAVVRHGRPRAPVGAAGIVPQPPIVDRAGGPLSRPRLLLGEPGVLDVPAPPPARIWTRRRRCLRHAGA